MSENLSSDLQSGALIYHSRPRPGKLEIRATKPLGNQRDLALAYSPGVAAACLEIAADPDEARAHHSRQNLVGCGHQRHRRAGPRRHRAARRQAGDGRQGRPVQEIRRHRRVRHRDRREERDKLVDVIAALEPTFGGINLEDIKAPECFEVERRLRERMKFPVFHDDQHGTAIIVGAAVTNGLKLAGKNIGDAKSSRRAPARRRWPAWTCWSRSARNAKTSGHRSSRAWSGRAATN